MPVTGRFPPLILSVLKSSESVLLEPEVMIMVIFISSKAQAGISKKGESIRHEGPFEAMHLLIKAGG